MHPDGAVGPVVDDDEDGSGVVLAKGRQFLDQHHEVAVAQNGHAGPLKVSAGERDADAIPSPGTVWMSRAGADTLDAKLGDEIGIEKVTALAHEFGVRSELHNYPSITLGSDEVTLMEMTTGFGVLAIWASHLHRSLGLSLSRAQRLPTAEESEQLIKARTVDQLCAQLVAVRQAQPA